MTAAYTDDDVQAALTAAANRDLCEHELALATNEKPVPSWVCEPCEMRAVLAAVAPAIAARAAATVLRETASVLRKIGDHGADGEATPYETADWLTTRADEIERTH